MNENPNDQKQDKNEQIENNDRPAPGVREDDDMDLDDGMDVEEPESVGARHGDEDPESGKNLDKDDRIPQDSDPSE